MNIQYSHLLSDYSREEIINRVKTAVHSKRFEHILRVEKMAVQLAKQYGESIEKASLAALIHDYAKERPLKDFKHVREDEALFLPYGNNICHGWLGAYLAKKELHIHDESVLHAMQIHTTGDVHLSLLDKIIFMADYIEEGRTFPGVEVARQLAFDNLDQAVYYKLYHTLVHLIDKEIKLFPKAVEAYNYYYDLVKENVDENK